MKAEIGHNKRYRNQNGTHFSAALEIRGDKETMPLASSG